MIGIDHHLGDHRDHLDCPTGGGEGVAQGAPQQVSDAALSVCHQYVEGGRVHLVLARFVAQQGISHLRPVAVNQHQAGVGWHQPEHGVGERRGVALGDRRIRRVGKQGVPAEGYDRGSSPIVPEGAGHYRFSYAEIADSRMSIP